MGGSRDGNICRLFDLGAHDPSAVDTGAIIRKSVIANDTDWRAQPGYAYRQDDVRTKIDWTGQSKTLQSRTYEIMMIEGSPYQRVVAIQHEPLSREREQQEELKLNHETQRRRAESKSDRQARVAKYRAERADEHLLMDQMVNAFNFHFVREESLNGSDCYLFQALPNADYRPPVEKARVLAGMRGQIWIEKYGFHWARVEAEVIQPVEFGFFIAKVKPGTRFELDQESVGDVWLPKHFEQSVNASIFGLYGYRSTDEQTFSDYRENTLRTGAPASAN